MREQEKREDRKRRMWAGDKTALPAILWWLCTSNAEVLSFRKGVTISFVKTHLHVQSNLNGLRVGKAFPSAEQNGHCAGDPLPVETKV